jgi:hypothetical protein
MDWRMTKPLNELEEREGIRIYRFQVAGGIRRLAEGLDPFLSQPFIESAQKAIEGKVEEFLMSLHGGGCAGYSDVLFPTSEDEMRLHVMHLAKARGSFQRLFPGMPIRVLYARLKVGTTDELELNEILA